MQTDKISILYVDDEANNLIAFKAAFRRKYEVHTAESAVEGRKILDEKNIHIVITDQRMPHITGIEFLESIIKDHPNPIRILLTGYADIQAVVDAINRGQVFRYITKPWNEQELILTIENAYKFYSLARDNEELMRKLMEANQQLEFMLRQKLIS